MERTCPETKKRQNFNHFVFPYRKQSIEKARWDSKTPRYRPLRENHLDDSQRDIHCKSSSYWVHKEDDVFKEDFKNLWVLSRLFVFNE